MELKITHTVVVKDKKERIALNPKKGWMAVQKDEHERYYFDGEMWRLWKLGTPRHFRPAGKPQPSQGVPQLKRTKGTWVLSEKKKKDTTAYIVIAVVMALLVAYILIN